MATPQPPTRFGGTSPVQQIDIRHVFRNEFGFSYARLWRLQIRTLELFTVLTTKRHADIDDEDDGSFHHEVLKNTIDLLQRFHRCDPLYPNIDVADKHLERIDRLFAKDVFCRFFCDDTCIQDFDNVEYLHMWTDLARFTKAIKHLWDHSRFGGLRPPGTTFLEAVRGAPEVWAMAGNRGRKNKVLWELMGLTSKALRERRTRHTNPESWCLEATIRVRWWRKRLRNEESLFQLPIASDGEVDLADDCPELGAGAMDLFNELEAKLRALYTNCDKQMPEQVVQFPWIPKSPVAPTQPAAPMETPALLAPMAPIMAKEEACAQKDSDGLIKRDKTNPGEDGDPGEMRDESDERTVNGESAPKKDIPLPFGDDVPASMIIHTTAMPNLQEEVKVHWALTQRTFGRGKLNHRLTREKIWQFSAPRNDMNKALKEAKELITNMLHSNGLDPGWGLDKPGKEG